jgi:hypothetical protein
VAESRRTWHDTGTRGRVVPEEIVADAGIEERSVECGFGIECVVESRKRRLAVCLDQFVTKSMTASHNVTSIIWQQEG